MAKDSLFTYPVAERALEKWRSNNLKLIESTDGCEHYQFEYRGSTCNNGGTPFGANLHMIVDSASEDISVANAWIEIPDEYLEGAKEMCGFRSSGEQFLEDLNDKAEFISKKLDDIILDNSPINHAGCFCTEPMLNQKWKMALSTLRYALAKRDE